MTPSLPSPILLDPLLRSWLQEDLGRGDHTTTGILDRVAVPGQATWILKEAGVVAGLPLALQVFQLLDSALTAKFWVEEGQSLTPGTILAEFNGEVAALLMGERVGLNLVMRLSGIATATRAYVDRIADLPAQLVDTRKTTPGLRLLEKYASRVGGAHNHRLGLDDAIMIKDNHIAAAGGILAAIVAVKRSSPYPLSIEVETETLAQVEEALQGAIEVIMLDNMPLEQMQVAVERIRNHSPHVKIEASGNITLDRIRAVAETGVDFISTSAPITRSTWLDLSMRLI
ncbi:MAG: carboxylating nicotinate-nucleotide diphosphorylase [Prochlorotrichaceae cyanobacterium]|jgi:nicotinate-nucleotide pyrophosphorylase (carboxylating)